MVAKQIQIKNHVLILKHVKLDEKSTKEILEKYNIDKFQLPHILKKDPAAKILGAEIGDVIEVERPSETVNKTKFYRVVVGS